MIPRRGRYRQTPFIIQWILDEAEPSNLLRVLLAFVSFPPFFLIIRRKKKNKKETNLVPKRGKLFPPAKQATIHGSAAIDLCVVYHVVS